MLKKYDLEQRTLVFAKAVRDYIKVVPRTITNLEYAKQLTRSAGSIAANYIEANEALSKKDFILRIKISKKEAKETTLWLHLIEGSANINVGEALLKEAIELMNILGAILQKV